MAGHRESLRVRYPNEGPSPAPVFRNVPRRVRGLATIVPMLDGPKLTESEIFERIIAIFQTYESRERSVRHTTAIVFEQRPPALTLDGESPAYLLWLVEADSLEGNTWQTRGFQTRASAERAAVAWLGSDRRVDWEQVSPSALSVVMSQIQRIAWR
jgi:hypothetical protein